MTDALSQANKDMKNKSSIKDGRKGWFSTPEMSTLRQQKSRITELEERVQFLINTFTDEAKDLRSAASEKYAGSEDGFNYHSDDRHAMFAEADLLDRIVKELESVLK